MTRVDVVIPVLNEEHSLPHCIEVLHEFLSNNLTHQWRIIIADNGSVDRTLDVANAYSARYPSEVGVIHLGERGRGRALKAAWLGSNAEVVAYMDVDLSTGIESFPALVSAIVDERHHIAWGSRLSRGSSTVRSLRREIISRLYNWIIRLSLRTHFRDAQCGFKAMDRAAVSELLPHIKDNEWFFDTELLVVAEKRGFRWKEIPVRWSEDPDSRVKVVKTALDDLKGLARLRFKGLPQARVPD